MRDRIFLRKSEMENKGSEMQHHYVDWLHKNNKTVYGSVLKTATCNMLNEFKTENRNQKLTILFQVTRHYYGECHMATALNYYAVAVIQ